MATLTRKRVLIEVNPGDKEKLQEIAFNLGCVQTRGSQKGKGSISCLMQAIAKGEVEIISNPLTPA